MGNRKDGERVNGWLDGWKMTRWKAGDIMAVWLAGKGFHRCVDEWINGWVGEQMGKWMTGGLNGQIYKWMNGWWKSWVANKRRFRITTVSEIYLIKKLAMNDQTSELISTPPSDIKDEQGSLLSSYSILQKGKIRSVCPRCIFPSSWSSSFRLGSKVGKSWAGPLTSELHFPSFGSAAGGSSVPLWGEEPREPCVTSWGVRIGWR